MYRWRKLTCEEQNRLLDWRRQSGHPWHRPPHPNNMGGYFHLTAACFEHAPVIGAGTERLMDFSRKLIATLSKAGAQMHAWCVLPNHYHVLVMVTELRACIHALGQLHGRTSHAWNGEDAQRGRKVWCPPSDRAMRSVDHFWATVNYIHHNAVRHGYVGKWTDWPFSSAADFLDEVGREEAERIWKGWPPGDYGDGWDDAKL